MSGKIAQRVFFNAIPREVLETCNCMKEHRDCPEVHRAFQKAREIALAYHIDLREIQAIVRSTNGGLVIDDDQNISFAGDADESRAPCGSLKHVVLMMDAF